MPPQPTAAAVQQNGPAICVVGFNVVEQLIRDLATISVSPQLSAKLTS